MHDLIVLDIRKDVYGNKCKPQILIDPTGLTDYCHPWPGENWHVLNTYEVPVTELYTHSNI